MTRKIILGLIGYALLFLAAGAYVAIKTSSTTAHVEEVVRLHRAEVLRDAFLHRVRALQPSRAADAIPENADAGAAQLRRAIGECFGCHHSPESTSRLGWLQELTGAYQAALASADTPAGAGAAEALGDELARQMQLLIDTTNEHLASHTLSALAEVRRTSYVVYAVVLIGPALSALLWLLAGRRLTRSVDALVEATRRVKAGDLDHRVEGLRDEFAELSDAFNEMAASLKHQLQLMQRTQQMVVVGELGAGLVHEIKNPLAGIKAAVQVLSQEPGIADGDRQVLRAVAREVVGLESLLRGFLEFARPPQPRFAEVDVNAFIESVVAFYTRSHATHDRPVRIVRALGAVPPVQVDPMQLKQVLLNLLLNAVDAMPEGGAIEVRTSVDGPAGDLHIDVVDRGRGIAPEHVDEVFRPFFTTKPGGTGLGLAVSKRLAEQQGGSLSFTRNSGGGTTFRVRLPAARAA